MHTLDRPVTVEAALAALGDTADQVAATLAKGGDKYRGARCQALDCPVAHYLLETTDEPWHVGDNYIDPGHVPFTNSDSVRIPTPVQEFIVGFDYGRYPSLIRDGSDYEYVTRNMDGYE